MDPIVVGGVLGVLAVIGRLLRDWFDRIVIQERDEFEVRLKPDESLGGSIDFDELVSKLDQEFGPTEQGGAPETGSRRLQALEVRLAELEKEQQTNQQDFAVQREYHALGLAQSKISFTLGYLFGALGAIVLLAGAIKLLFFSEDQQATIAIFTAVAGAIPEALAGLLFVSANRAGTRMTENFDRGREDRDLAAAQRIAADMEDRELGNRLQAIIALSMARSRISSAALKVIGAEGSFSALGQDETESSSPGCEG